MVRRQGAKGLNFSRRRKKLNIPLLKEIGIWVIEILIVLLMAYVLVYFAGMRITVVGQSMNPTLENGQQILINRFSYKLTDPDPNDVIVFLPNGNEKSHYYVKRVIAVPGDTVQIKNGAVYVNGELFDEVVETAAIEEAGIADEEIVVGEDEYFVLGDNRNNSEDSRYANIGNVKKEHIVGKAWMIISPFRDIGRVK
ncbi:MAG: signal peptidase I [Roseburia sp.]